MATPEALPIVPIVTTFDFTEWDEGEQDFLNTDEVQLLLPSCTPT